MTAINATEAELTATAEVLKLAAILDDRASRADKARIAAWAEQIHRHSLTREDLLDGLQAFYDNDPKARDRAIGIADLTHHARRIKRDRLDREEDTARETRQAELDIKATDDVRGLLADAITGRTKETPRVHGRRESMTAIREYLTARKEAAKR